LCPLYNVLNSYESLRENIKSMIDENKMLKNQIGELEDMIYDLEKGKE
jgi:chaperonin cofactor prefoldin